MNINEKFVNELYLSIIKEGEKFYEDVFDDTYVAECNDEYWKDVFDLYRNLSNKEKSVLSKMIKHVQIDTISYVLGIIDGCITVDNYPEIEPKLLLNREDSNGDLQDIFLELVEENEKL